MNSRIVAKIKPLGFVGFDMSFIQKFWHVTKEVILKVFKDFLLNL